MTDKSSQVEVQSVRSTGRRIGTAIMVLALVGGLACSGYSVAWPG